MEAGAVPPITCPVMTRRQKPASANLNVDSTASRYRASGGAQAQVPSISMPTACAISMANTSESFEKPTQWNLVEFRMRAARLSSIAMQEGTPRKPKYGV